MKPQLVKQIASRSTCSLLEKNPSKIIIPWITSEIAKTAVPELNAFIELCENNEFGKVISAKDVISGVGV